MNINCTDLKHLYIDNKLSAHKIASQYQVKPGHIYYLLNKFNIPRRTFMEMDTEYSVNDKYFSSIDSDEKAYWLGFLYADGYITSRDKVGLSLAIKDRNHIEKFKSAIQSTHPIKEYSSFGYCETKYARLIFTSHEMTKDLKKLGCVEHKTLVLKFPNKDMVPNEYLNAFVRGYLDGDGCITTSGEKMPLCLKFCGTREFLLGLISYFNTLLYPEMIKNKIYKRHNDDKNTYQLDIHSFSKCKAILDELYRDAQVYLDRKYILYLQKATQQSSLPEMVDV